MDAKPKACQDALAFYADPRRPEYASLSIEELEARFDHPNGCDDCWGELGFISDYQSLAIAAAAEEALQQWRAGRS